MTKKNPAAIAKPMGRPPKPFDPEQAAFLISRIATSSDSLRTILELDTEHNLPDINVIYRWMRENDNFRKEYAHAKDEQWELIAGEMLDIADRPLKGEISTYRETKDGPFMEKKIADNVERSRQMIETRKWLLGKLKPKKYGDKLDIEHGGNIQWISPIPRPARNQAGSPSSNDKDKEPGDGGNPAGDR